MSTPVPRLKPSECAERVRSGESLLVDVREPNEWALGHAEGAKLLSLSDLSGPRTDWKPFLAGAAGREILLYCAAGGRSAIAAKVLASEGFKAVNAGSLGEWRSFGWPITGPR